MKEIAREMASDQIKRAQNCRWSDTDAFEISKSSWWDTSARIIETSSINWRRRRLIQRTLNLQSKDFELFKLAASNKF